MRLTFHVFREGRLIGQASLVDAVIKIGSQPSSELRLQDPSVSRLHAVIEVAGPDHIQLFDLGSSRGTSVNGVRVDKCRLRSGNVIRLGDLKLVLTIEPVAHQVSMSA